MADKPKILSREEVEKLLEVTDEKLEKIKLEQEKIKKSPFINLSREEQVILRSYTLEEHYKQTKNYEGLAEALAMRGEYDKAEKISNDKERKKFYKKMRIAVDTPKCDCSEYSSTIDNGKEILIKVKSEFTNSFDPYTKKFIKIYFCSNCQTYYSDEA